MRRFVNFRMPVIFACSLVLGILAGYLLNYYNTDIVYVIAVVPFAAIFFIAFIFMRKPKYIFFTAVISVLILCGAVSSFARLENFRFCEIDETQIYEVSGTVIEKGETTYGEYIIIDGISANGIPIGGKATVYLYGAYGDYCDTGYKVSFPAKVSANSLYPYGKLNRLAEDNVKYTFTAISEIESEYGFDLFGAIRSRIRSTLYENMDGDTAAVCYAMLIGDTSGIDDESLTTFLYGGIAHIFAVSGLHIGIVYSIITFLCRKSRANKYVAFGISIGFILFYAAICGFTLSSVRAVIMCTVSAATRLTHLKKDGLNSLSFAVIIILLITPLSLFSIGFQLSVCAVGGIFIFSNLIKRLLYKIKTPKKLADGAGASLGAQLGTLPVMMSGFGYVSGAGLILNIVIIPVLSALFVLLFVCTLLCAILQPLGVALTYAVLPLQAILSFLVTAGFEKALIRGFGTGFFAVLYYVGMLTLTDKLNFKAVPRAACAAAAVFVMAIFVLAQTFPLSSGHTVAVSGFSGGGCVIVKSRHGNVLIMTENANTSAVFSALNGNYAIGLDGVILLGGENCAATYDTDLNCADVYVSNLYIPVQPYNKVQTHYAQSFNLCGVQFEFYDGYSVRFEIDGVSVGVCAGRDIPFESCDLLISKYLDYDFEEQQFICDAENIVYFSQKGYKFNIYEYGDMLFTTKDGALKFNEPVRHP